MPVLTIDERRRLTLPKEIADDAERFVALKTSEGILLKPLPQDPIATLQKLGRKLKGMSRKEIRKLARKAALQEVGK